MSSWAVGSSGQGTGILKVELKLVAYLTSDGPENLVSSLGSQPGSSEAALDRLSYQILLLPLPVAETRPETDLGPCPGPLVCLLLGEGALAYGCLSRSPIHVLKGVLGKFAPRFSLCPVLVWSWDPEGPDCRALPFQSPQLTGRATEGKRDSSPAWTRGSRLSLEGPVRFVS